MVLIFSPPTLQVVEGAKYLIEHIDDFDWPERLG